MISDLIRKEDKILGRKQIKKKTAIERDDDFYNNKS